MRVTEVIITLFTVVSLLPSTQVINSEKYKLSRKKSEKNLEIEYTVEEYLGNILGNNFKG